MRNLNCNTTICISLFGIAYNMKWIKLGLCLNLGSGLVWVLD